MRKRRPNGEKAINASQGSRLSMLRDSLWSAQDSARTGASRAADSAYFTLRDRVLLPLEDRAELAGRPARALGAAVLVLLAIGIGVGGLVWAAPDHKSSPTTVAEVAAPAPAPAKAEPTPAQPAAPTLHGAAPEFGGGTGGDATVSAAEALAGGEASGSSASAGANGNASGADAKISSQPSSSTTADGATASAATGTKPAKGPVAGAAAVAVAREFAGAFVSYEIGGAEDPSVQKTFAATSTPQLARALLQRPPRQPAAVRVPQAKVLNIVPAPSRGGVFPVSVSLLRVGTTSELRLEMEKLKGKRWRVTNVLG